MLARPACTVSFIAGIVYIIMLVRRRARIWQRPARRLVHHVGMAAVIALVPLVVLAGLMLFF